MKRHTELNKSLTHTAALIACMILTACETTDPKKATPKGPPEQQLKVGMTKEEVTKLLGKPRGVMNSNMGETWSYNDMVKAFIPLYSISGGKFKSISIAFDNDGKVATWSTSSSGLY